MISFQSLRPAIRFSSLLLLLALPLIINYFFGWSLEKESDKFLITLLFILSFLLFVLIFVATFKKKIVRYLIASILLTPVFLAELLRLLSYYLQQESFNERFFFHFNINTLAEAGGAYPEMIILFVGVFVLMQWALYWNTARGRIRPALSLSYLLLTLTIVFFSAPKSAVAELYSVLKNNLVYEDSIQTSELNPLTVQKYQSMGINVDAITQAKIASKAGKNLLFIYLESMESIYSDPDIFSALTPAINNYKIKGYNFENIYQTLGTGWTIAGMVASQCGTPLLLNSIKNANDAMSDGFFNQAICLGDILKQAGYNQSYMGGATIKFAGKGKFYREHGYDSVQGVDELIGKIISPDYKTGWGLYDDSLFDLALDEYRRLAQLKKPFNLTLLTIDTHHPNGHASQSCKPYPKIKNTILNAVYCTDQLLHRFLDELSQEVQFKDTLVVLMSDHLAMRNKAYPLFPKDYERKILFTILNSAEKGNNYLSGTHMDVAPTILDALGVDYNTHFLLGESLMQASLSRNISNITSEETLQMIREINTKYFSHSNINICNGENLIKFINNEKLMLGNQLIDLKLGGFTLPIEDFKEELALLVIIENNGTVKSFSMIDINAIPGVIYNKLEHYLLIVTAAKQLPWNIDQKLNRKEGTYSVIFGQAPYDFELLGEVKSLNQLNIANNSCNMMQKKEHQSLEQRQKNIVSYYEQHCHLNNRDNIPKYSSNTAKLYIPDLSDTYSVVLEKNNEQFVAVTHNVHDAQFEAKNRQCMPELTDHSIYFPVISIDNILHYSMEMKRTGTFSIKIHEKDKKSFDIKKNK